MIDHNDDDKLAKSIWDGSYFKPDEPKQPSPDSAKRAAALRRAADRLGVDAADLGAIISFETGGTFDPHKVGGEGNKYRGLIQFGPEEQRQYYSPKDTFETQVENGVVRFIQDRFKKANRDTAGASLEDLYTAVIAGNPGANRNAKDAFGTSARSGAARILAEHRPKVLKSLFGGREPFEIDAEDYAKSLWSGDAASPEDTAAAIWGDKGRTQPSPTNPSPNFVQQPEPESLNALQTQAASAAAGNTPRMAVLLTPGQPIEAIDPSVVKALTRIETKHGALLVNPRKLQAAGITDVQAFIEQNGIAGLIGKVENIDDTSKGVAVVTTDEHGRELASSVVTSEAAAKAQIEADRASFPNAADSRIVPVGEAVNARRQEVAGEIATLGGTEPIPEADEAEYQAYLKAMGFTPTPESDRSYREAFAIAKQAESERAADAAKYAVRPQQQPARQSKGRTKQTGSAPTIRSPKAIGRPSTDLDTVAFEYKLPKKTNVFGEKELKQALLATGQVTPAQADAYIASRRAAGTPVLSRPYAGGQTIQISNRVIAEATGAISEGDVIDRGLADARSAQNRATDIAMEQSQNRLQSPVSTAKPAKLPEAEAEKELEKAITAPAYSAQARLKRLITEPWMAMGPLGLRGVKYDPTEEKERLKKEHGSFGEALANEQYYQQMGWAETSVRMANQTARSFAKNLIGGTGKTIAFIADLTEDNAIMQAIPEQYRPGLRNAVNVADLVARLMGSRDASKTYYEWLKNRDTDSTPLEKQMAFRSLNEFEEAVGSDPKLKERFLGAVSDGAGSALSFIALGAVMPSMRIAKTGRDWSLGLAGSLQTAGPGYEEGRQSGLSEGQSKLYGMFQGLLGASEMFGAGAELASIIKNPTLRAKVANAILETAKATGREAKQEFGQEVFQTVSGKAALEFLQDDAPTLEALYNALNRLPDQVADAVSNEGLVALITGGGMGAATSAVSRSLTDSSATPIAPDEELRANEQLVTDAGRPATVIQDTGVMVEVETVDAKGNAKRDYVRKDQLSRPNETSAEIQEPAAPVAPEALETVGDAQGEAPKRFVPADLNIENPSDTAFAKKGQTIQDPEHIKEQIPKGQRLRFKVEGDIREGTFDGTMIVDDAGQQWGIMGILSPRKGEDAWIEFADRPKQAAPQQVQKPAAPRSGRVNTFVIQPPKPKSIEAATERITELTEQRDTARREADTDPLTGIANRRALDRALPSAEKDPNVAVISFDANNFGQVNKELGEKQGDVALQDLAEALDQATSENGSPFRIFRRGGDEFVALVPKDKADVIRQRAEELYGDKTYGKTTVSLSGTIGDNFDEANEALQKRKAERKAGRAKAEPDTDEYFKGDRIRYTDEPAPEGFRSFVYLEGHKKGETGIKLTPEAKAADIAEQRKRDAELQEGFRRVAVSEGRAKPDATTQSFAEWRGAKEEQKPAAFKAATIETSRNTVKLLNKSQNANRLRKQGYEFEIYGKSRVRVTKAPEGKTIGDFEIDVFNIDQERLAQREANKGKRKRDTKGKPLSASAFAVKLGGIRPTKYDKGEAARLSAKESGRVGLVNQNSEYTAEQLGRALVNYGYFQEFADERGYIDPDQLISLLEEDIAAGGKYFPIDSIEEAEADIEEQQIDHYAQQQKEADIERRLSQYPVEWFEELREIARFATSDEAIAILFRVENGIDSPQIKKRFHRLGQEYDIPKDIVERIYREAELYRDAREGRLDARQGTAAAATEGISRTDDRRDRPADAGSSFEPEALEDADIDSFDFGENAKPLRQSDPAWDQTDLFGNKVTPKTEQRSMFDEMPAPAPATGIEGEIANLRSRSGNEAIAQDAEDALSVYNEARRTGATVADMLRQGQIDGGTVADTLSPRAIAFAEAMEAGDFAAEVKRAQTGGEVLFASDYRGGHLAPGPDDAPLHDITKGGEIYPEDIYSPMGLRYYGTGDDKADAESMGVIHRVRNRPNARVKIYRAVPYKPSAQESIAKLEEQKRAYLRRGAMPDDSKFENGSRWYDWASDEIDRLKNETGTDSPQTFDLNSGDWVTLSRTYAKDHGESALNGQYKIISKTVRARNLFTNGDSINEFGYWSDNDIASQASGEALFARDASGFDTEQIEREIAKVKPVRDDQGRLLAPNGKPSNLPNERVWKMVRTPAFVSFFGDWQAADRKSRLLSQKPIAVTSVPTSTSDRQALYDDARTKFQGSSVFNADFGREIQITGRGLKHIKATGDFSKAALLPHTDTILRNGVYLGAEPSRTADNNIKQYHRLATRAEVGGETFIVESVVRETNIGDLLYDWSLSGIIKPAGISGEVVERGDPSLRPAAGSTPSNLLQRLLDFNDNSASKVVDENGEPMVVYHGTNKSFDAFDKRFIGSNARMDRKGFFFTNEPETAEIFAVADVDEVGTLNLIEESEGANIISAFVSIKNPLTFDEVLKKFDLDESDIYEEYDHVGEFFDGDRPEIIEMAEAKGADGILLRSGGFDQVVAFSPTQIKSATGNRGTFDRNEPSILRATGRPGGIDAAFTEGLTENVAKQRNDWAAKVAAFFASRVPTSSQIIMDGTPAVLKRLGVPAKEIYTTPDVLEKLKGEHGLDQKQITNLFNDIIDPVMVFDLATVPGSKVIVTNQKDYKGDSIIIAIKPNGKVTLKTLGSQGRTERRDVAANILTSAYGTTNRALQFWIDDGLLLYRNVNKARERWHGPNRLQLPTGTSRRSSPTRKILTEADFVKDGPDALFKLRTTEDYDLLYETLPAVQNPAEVLKEATGGTFNDQNELELTPHDAEIVRRLYGTHLQGNGADPDGAISFHGVVFDSKTLRAMGRLGKQMADSMREYAELAPQADTLERLAVNLIEAANRSKDFGILYVFDESLPEERFHQEDLRAGRTDARAERELRKMVGPLMTRKFRDNYGNQSFRDIASEMVAKLATGQEKDYGWDKTDGFEDLRRQIFNTWVEGVIRNNAAEIAENGIDAFFDKFKRIGEVYAQAKAGNEGRIGRDQAAERSSERVSGRDRRNEGEVSASGQTEAESGAETDQYVRDNPARGKQKERRVITSAEKYGALEPSVITGEARYYTVKSADARTRRAQDKIERLGLDAAVAEAGTMIDRIEGADEQVAFQWEVVHLLNSLADANEHTQLAAGYRAQAQLIIDTLAKQGTLSGLLTQSFDQVRKDDARTVREYVNRRRRVNGADSDLTDEQAKELQDAVTALAESQSRVEELEAKIREYESREKGGRRLTKRERTFLKVLSERSAAALQRVRSAPLRATGATLFAREQMPEVADGATNEVLFQTAPPSQSVQGQLLSDLADIGAAILFDGFYDTDVITPEEFREIFNRETGGEYEAEWERIHAYSMARLTELRNELLAQNAIDRVLADNPGMTKAEAEAKIAAEKADRAEKGKIRAEHRKMANAILKAEGVLTPAQRKSLVRQYESAEKKAAEKKMLERQRVLDFLETAAKTDPKASPEVLALAAMLETEPGLTVAEAERRLRQMSPEIAPADDAKAKDRKAAYENISRMLGEARVLQDKVRKETLKQRDIARGKTEEAKAALEEAKAARREARSGFDALAARLERPEKTAVQKAAQLQRMMMVSALNTAANNAVSGVGTRGMVRIVDVLDAAIQKAARRLGKELKDEGITADTRFFDVLGIPATGGAKQYVREIASAHSMILRGLDEHPELFNELYGDYSADIEIMDGKGAAHGAVHKALDASIWAFDKINFANRWQEYFIRDVEAIYALQVRVGQRGLDLATLEAEGRMNEITLDDWRFAIDRARLVTYSRRPEKGTLADRTLKMLERHPVPTVLLVPFARFSWNAYNLMRQWTPVIAQIRAGKRVMSEDGARVRDLLSPTKYTSREIANSVAGLGFLVAAYSLYALAGDDREEWYHIKIPGTGLWADMRMHPQSAPFFYIAHKMRRWQNGLGMFARSTAKDITNELAEVFLSLSYRQAVDQNSLIQGIGYTLSSQLEQADREKNWDKGMHLLTKFAGERTGIVFSPARPFKNFLDSFATPGDVDLDGSPFWQGIERNVPNAIFKAAGVETKKNLDGTPRVYSPYAYLKPFGMNIVDEKVAKPQTSRTLQLARQLAFDKPYTPAVLPEERKESETKRQIYDLMDQLRKNAPEGLKGEAADEYYQPVYDAVNGAVEQGILTDGQADFILRSVGKSQVVSLVSRGKVENGLAVYESALTDPMLTDAERTEIKAILELKINNSKRKVEPKEWRQAEKLGLNAVRPELPTRVSEELSRLGIDTPGVGTALTPEGGRRRNLTAEEHAKYKRETLAAVNAAVEKYLDSAAYKTHSDEQRQLQIKRRIAKARQQAQARMRKTMPDEADGQN